MLSKGLVGAGPTQKTGTHTGTHAGTRFVGTGTAGTPPAPTPAPAKSLLSKGFGARVPGVPAFSLNSEDKEVIFIFCSSWCQKKNLTKRLACEVFAAGLPHRGYCAFGAFVISIYRLP